MNNLVAGRTYYFAVIARNASGLDSPPSNEVTYSVPRPGTNAPPIASAASVSVTEDVAKGITLTGSDPDGDALTYAVVSSPAHGTLSGSAPSLTYTPGARPGMIASCVIELLQNPAAANRMSGELKIVKASLGAPGASVRAAKLILDFLQK